MKAVFLAALVFMMFQGTANAISLPQFWTADGYREVTAVNTSGITYLPVSADNFDSLSRCESWIDEQNAMAPGQNVKNYAAKQRVVAACSQQR